ncbi:NAD(P)/FAD-dependent oxidoreductase [Acetonema longum]|uniref:Thioredoxin-disulfide reductase n=1 Tax=Acetonema longum DSM 6540 TaxID=1009370 RepID=F7NG42_9FIRM|nr:NAD(P)/FAD-dependent oxidoreductase [Acetonema longum]EGO64960.1 thioredoxin-disulfide reductase [Acetonema longum DSM 6540]
MSETIYDIAVVGGGPAGLSAALTGRIRNKNILLFEHLDFSLKLQKAHKVHNYLGIPEISGKDLMQQFVDHVLHFEPHLVKQKVVNVFPAGEGFNLLTPTDAYQAKTVILATGVVSTALFAGEREYLGRGVSYCATCDGMLYRNRDVAVISYTAEGEHEAEFLGEICRNVYYLPQYKPEQELKPERSNIVVRQQRPQKITGKDTVGQLITDKESLDVAGIFILRQSDPVENILAGIELNGEVIKVNPDMSTSIPGVFAAGDCTGKPLQISRATGQGLVAVLSAINYLDMTAT